jgi:hypothetical protein
MCCAMAFAAILPDVDGPDFMGDPPSRSIPDG